MVNYRAIFFHHLRHVSELKTICISMSYMAKLLSNFFSPLREGKDIKLYELICLIWLIIMLIFHHLRSVWAFKTICTYMSYMAKLLSNFFHH